MNVPAELKYTPDHEWVRVEGNLATIGITEWAQGELGDIVFVELPEVGDEVTQGGAFGTIEAVKAVSELYSPLSGKVTEINAALEDDPMIINREAFDGGWMIKIEVSAPEELNGLLESDAYRSQIEG